MPKSRHKPPDPPDQDENPEEDSDLSTPRGYRKRAAALRQRVEQLSAEAAALERIADEIEAIREGRGGSVTNLPLQPPQAASSVTSMTAAQLGFQTSKTKSKGNRLVQAANAAGFTLRTLATAVEKVTKIRTTHTHLSLAYKGKRPLQDRVKRAIVDLTGFSDWPSRT